jgi:3-oxoacyl-[acyl-carrier protein] reductase
MSYSLGGQMMSRIAIVTGGASGIGAAVARRLADSDHVVVIFDLQDGTRVASNICARGGHAVATVVDVRDATAVHTAVQDVLAVHKTIDVVVNSHGVGGPVAPLEEHSLAEWRDVIDINLTGAFHVCREVVGPMRAQQWGRIVNVASNAGKEGNPGMSAYSASKAGLIALTKVLAREVASEGILVNCVTPGLIDTPMTPPEDEGREYILSRTPMGRAGKPEEVAELVHWLCSDGCSFTCGAAVDISGGRAAY